MPQHVGAAPVERVRAGLGAHRDHGLPAPVLGAEVVGNDPDFLQAFRVRHDRGFVVASAHHRQTIQLNVIRERAPAVDANRRKLASSGDADAERIQVLGVRGGGARHGACLRKRRPGV